MKNLRQKLAKTSNQKLWSTLDARIRARKPVRFLPHHVRESDFGAVSGYHVLLFGILESGEPATVCMKNVRPTLHLRCPRGTSVNEFLETVKRKMRNNNVRFYSANIVRGTYFLGFNDEESFVELRFRNSATRKSDRRKALELFDGVYQMADNSKFSYYLSVARSEDLALGSWGLLNSYSYNPDCSWGYGRCFSIGPDGLEPLPEKVVTRNSLLLQPNLLIAGIDIECRSESGALPRPEIEEDEMFMICVSFVQERTQKAVYNVCICLYEAIMPEDAPKTKYVVCEDERAMILALAKTFREMRPDFVVDFNGGGFDWPWILFRADKHDVAHDLFEALSRTPYRRSLKPDAPGNYHSWAKYRENPVPADFLAKRYYCYYSRRVKLENKKFAVHTMPSVDGTIFIDSMQLLSSMYPKKASKSLNAFLKMMGLPVKLDINPHQLFQRAKNSRERSDEQTLREMGEVAHYCIVDAMSPVRLLLKRGVFQDKREEAVLFSVSQKEAFFSTDREKVTNIIFRRALRKKLLSPTANENFDKVDYDGALVLKPKKGLITSKPALRERLRDVRERGRQSGYFGIYSRPGADEFVRECERAILEGRDPELDESWKRVFDDFMREPMHYPVAGEDFSSLYPSLMSTYSISADRMVTAQLCGEDDVYARVRELEARGEKLYYTTYVDSLGVKRESWTVRSHGMGIYGEILQDLKQDRSRTKKMMNAYKYALEGIRAGGMHQDYWTPEQMVEVVRGVTSGFDAEYLLDLFREAGDRHTVESMDILRAMYDARQKKRKLAMNTMYGAAGFEKSPLYVPELAAAVTISGQYNLRLVRKFCLDNGFDVLYGDTDSVYVSPPAKVFADADRRYYGGAIDKRAYWEELITLSMPVFRDLQDRINVMLRQDNGGPYLKVAYEEVLWPVWMFGRKMYAGCEHENVPSVDSPKIFLRGVDIVRRDRSEMQKSVSRFLLDKAFDINNMDDVKRCAELAVHYYFEHDFDLEDFSKQARYMPIPDDQRALGKGNASVLNFADRMEKRGTPLVPGDKFRYIVADVQRKYLNEHGRVVTLKKSDMWETVAYAKEHGIGVDKTMYFDGIVNALSRYVGFLFISDDESLSYEERDRKSLDAAAEYLKCYAREAGLLQTGQLTGRQLKEAHKQEVLRQAQDLARRGAITEIPVWLEFYSECDELAKLGMQPLKTVFGETLSVLRRKKMSAVDAARAKFLEICNEIPDIPKLREEASEEEDFLEEHRAARARLCDLRMRLSSILSVIMSHEKYLMDRKHRTRFMGMTRLDRLWEKKVRSGK